MGREGHPIRKTAPGASLFLLALLGGAGAASAQRAGENAVTSAKDAFGTSVGNETIGLYRTENVRGFSPTDAGNIRIEGVYFDQQGFAMGRLTSGSTILVGLTAQRYPFPAPTGIVDYQLRPTGAEPLLSTALTLGPYRSPEIELDAQLPLQGERLGLAFGGSYKLENHADGTDASSFEAAVILRWRPTADIEITPFWITQRGEDKESGPTVVAAGPYLPPPVRRSHYFGQDWARFNDADVSTGAIVKANLGADFGLSGGLFYSMHKNDGRFAQIFGDTDKSGRTNATITPDPGQRRESISGELTFDKRIARGSFLHRLFLSFRGRRVRGHYGGEAARIDLGPQQLGEARPVPEPAPFSFRPFTHDRVTQFSPGLAYQGQIAGIGAINIGIERTSYAKEVAEPLLPARKSSREIWLPGIGLTGHLTARLDLYASYTRGFEEGGSPPDSAVNRTEVVAAIETRQVELGMGWQPFDDVRIIFGGFDIEKPYYSTDEANYFTVLGTVHHKGVEFSLSARPDDNLSILAGAVVMQPRVSGKAVDLGRIGPRPLDKSATTLRWNMDYSTPFLPGFSFDAATYWFSNRAASSDNLAILPARTAIDLGSRYRFTIFGAPTTFRAQLLDILQQSMWKITGSNAYRIEDGRRLSLSLISDF